MIRHVIIIQNVLYNMFNQLRSTGDTIMNTDFLYNSGWYRSAINSIQQHHSPCEGFNKCINRVMFLLIEGLGQSSYAVYAQQ